MTDRMYCYLWHDTAHPDECKFGERFVKSGVDPVKDCRDRVRSSLGVQKGRLDDGSVKIHHIWDVSELAEKVGKNKAHGAMDNWLREQIGYRKAGYAEVHTLPAADMLIRVNLLLAKLGQPLIHVSLSTKQFQVAEEVLGKIDEGARIFLASLCARFGKTIWSAAIAQEVGSDVIVIASYVKTVFTSFAGDLTSFQQFADYEHVDTGAEGYQEAIQTALASGRKVVAYLSMANGSKRQERIDFLAQAGSNRFLIIDEADFGVHREGQAQSLVDIQDRFGYILIMTGTNADRAVANWKIDHIVSVTYPELIMQKKATQSAA